MRIIKIPKKSGGFRTIYCPSSARKRQMRGHLPQLERIALLLDEKGVVHGFMPCRSPVTNALAHVGYKYTLSFDLQDFFEHVTYAKVRMITKVERTLFDVVTNKACQGFPTSPVLANIAFSKVDNQILEELKGCDVRYTRYADDLTFSFNELAMKYALLDGIPATCSENGFFVNPKKTHFQAASQGRRIITGVAVDDTGVYPTRRTKRRLRAARHQNKAAQVRGLEEWAKCKAPHWETWASKRLTESANSVTIKEVRKIGSRTKHPAFMLASEEFSFTRDVTNITLARHENIH